MKGFFMPCRGCRQAALTLFQPACLFIGSLKAFCRNLIKEMGDLVTGGQNGSEEKIISRH